MTATNRTAMDDQALTIPEPERAEAPRATPPILIDYVGHADQPAHRMAPFVAALPDTDPLVLQPGLNPVDQDVWGVYVEDHKAVAAIVKDKLALVLDGLPRKLGPLEDLIPRTFCAHGLDAIEASERAYYGDKPRRVVMQALDKQRARVSKCRAKQA